MIDLTTITVAQFKAYFYRDFPYLPVWDVSQLYNKNSRIYYPTTLLFYDCQVNGTIATVPSGVSPWLNTPGAMEDNIYNYIQDQDISKAFGQAQVNLNQGLFASDSNTLIGYYYLTAHYLAIDLRAANGGIAAIGAFPVNSRSAGSIAEAYGIPQAYLNNPLYAQFTQTAYGMKFLSLVQARLVGNIVAVVGFTKP